MGADVISVEILGKIYKVKCKAENVHGLRDAAVYLDKEMRNVRDNSQVIGLDRVAVITALNLAYQLLSIEKQGGKDVSVFTERVADLQKRIENALTQSEQLTLDKSDEN